MKNILVTLLATVSLLGAVEIPESLLVNQAEMVEKKLSKMHKLVAFVSSSSMVEDKNNNVQFEHSFTDEEKNSKSLGEIVKGYKWNFALHNPLGVVSLNITVYDKHHNILFVSQTGFRLAPQMSEDGSVFYTTNDLHVSFYSPELSLYVGDAYNVRVNTRDSHGWEKKTWGHNLNPVNKSVKITNLSHERKGEIILYFNDNGVISSEAYDLGTGDKLDEVPVSLWIESSVQNVWVVDPTALSFSLSPWIDPTALLLEVHVEEKGLYLIDLMTEGGITPNEIVVTFPNKEKVTTTYLKGEKHHLPLVTGVNYIRFNWPQEVIDAYLDSGGGKG